MKTKRKYRLGVIIVSLFLILVVLISALDLLRGSSPLAQIIETPDPHEGQVYVNDGLADVWLTPLEGVPVSTLTAADFTQRNGQIMYTGTAYTVLRGIDVSEHQLTIDWKEAAQNVDFAYIRAGYRGFTEGGLFTDARFDYNFKNAEATGLKLGVYFFSQAITPEEAAEEADYLIDLLDGADLDLPVIYDWEKIEETTDPQDAEIARTKGLDGDTVTDCAAAFCARMEAAGYDAGVYFNKQTGYYTYDLSQLTAYTFWLADPGDYPDFYYASSIWQYTLAGQVDGIGEAVDMNLMFLPNTSADAK